MTIETRERTETVDVVVIASLGDSLRAFRGDLLKQMRARGQVVVALAPEISETTRAWLTSHQIEFEEAPLARTGTNVAADLRFLLWLRSRIREMRPTVVLAYTVKPVVYGMLASPGRRLRRYALITGLGYAFTDGSGRRTVVRALVENLYRAALRRADLVFFQNSDDERLFRERRLLGARTPSLVVAGSGIDLESFAAAPVPARPQLVFLMIARLLGDKGVREYVAAARQVRTRYPNARFRLAGWIDTNPDAVRQYELDGWIEEGTIEYLGHLTDVRPALHECDVYVLPSYREGTPRTVLEALAVGRAVVTTDAPGCRETVVEGKNGYLVPPKTVEPLVAALERFVERPQLAIDMGVRSRELAVSKYDVRLVSKAMLDAMRLGVAS